MQKQKCRDQSPIVFRVIVRRDIHPIVKWEKKRRRLPYLGKTKDGKELEGTITGRSSQRKRRQPEVHVEYPTRQPRHAVAALHVFMNKSVK